MKKRDSSKYGRRDRKRKKARHGMRVSGRSLFTIVEKLRKRAKDAQSKK